jgi:hypothetical protein
MYVSIVSYCIIVLWQQRPCDVRIAHPRTSAAMCKRLVDSEALNWKNLEGRTQKAEKELFMFVILCCATLSGVAVIRLPAERSGFECRQGQRFFSFPEGPDRFQGPTKPRIHWVKVKVKVTLQQATKA